MNNAYLIFLSHQNFLLKVCLKYTYKSESPAYDDGNGYSHATNRNKKSKFIYIYSISPSKQPSIHFFLKSTFPSDYLFTEYIS